MNEPRQHSVSGDCAFKDSSNYVNLGDVFKVSASEYCFLLCCA